MKLDNKKTNLFIELCDFLASCKGLKRKVYNNIRKLIVMKNSENTLIKDIDDTFTIREYIELFHSEVKFADTDLYKIKRNSLTKTFTHLVNEKELSNYFKIISNENDYVKSQLNSKISMKNYIKNIYGAELLKDEMKYNDLATKIFLGFVQYAEHNLDEKPFLQPLLKGWRLIL